MGEDIRIIGKGSRRSAREARRDTEKGLNKQEAFTISRLEAQIRNRKTEKGYVIGEDGKVIGESTKSTRDSARFDPRALKKDSIVTHNHPYVGNKGRRLYDTMAGRIGVPFSPADVSLAIRHDVKEIRAVTPTYTWSIRRPAGGWGDTLEIMRDIRSMSARMQTEGYQYQSRHAASSIRSFRETGSRRRAEEVADRANVGVQYQALKNLAKKYGWEFTRRKAV